MLDEYQRLAALVAVCGRIEASRLQKLIHVLQMRGAPFSYEYRTIFGFPYSEDLESDLQLLEQLGLIERDVENLKTGKKTSCFRPTKIALDYIKKAPELRKFDEIIKELPKTDAHVLDLIVRFGALKVFNVSPPEARNQVREMAKKSGDEHNQERVEELLSRWKMYP